MVRDSGIKGEALEKVRAWARDEFVNADRGSRRRVEIKPGDFLSNPLVTGALEKMLETPEAPFYLPWKADYRGRIYAETPWFTPQGGDLQRALLMFHRGQVLNNSGVSAFKGHGGNLVKRDRMLKDLGIKDRKVVTLKERERWVELNEEKILATADAPMTEPLWREAASKPMQFLAFCRAYADWKRNPGSPCRLPVQIDGTCNGLQHIAVLTGDGTLARAVNVVPAEGGLPGDIYTDLATVAQRLLDSGMPSVKGREYLAPAIRLLKGIDSWRGRMDRAAAKQVVMTIPYGAGESTQARRVLKEALGRLPMKDLSDEQMAAMDEIRAWVDAGDEETRRKRQRQVLGVVKPMFQEEWKAARARNDAAALAEVARIEAVHAAVALTIVVLVGEALKDHYPVVGRFTTWLKTVARRNKGIPLGWVTPIGFPVLQDGFRLKQTEISMRRGPTESIRVGYKEMLEVVDDSRQLKALLPNLIHSLDASHLAITLGKAVEAGISEFGSIHDCLLCHPNDAERLGQIVRQAFVDLYSKAGPEGELKRWQSWMSVVAQIATTTKATQILRLLDEASDLGPTVGEEDRKLADQIRALRDQEQLLARLMLRYAVRVPQEPPTNAVRRRPIEGARRKNHADSQPIREPAKAINARERFELNEVLASLYFFS